MRTEAGQATTSQRDSGALETDTDSLRLVEQLVLQNDKRRQGQHLRMAHFAFWTSVSEQQDRHVQQAMGAAVWDLLRMSGARVQGLARGGVP
jgi:hypothetical protein